MQSSISESAPPARRAPRGCGAAHLIPGTDSIGSPTLRLIEALVDVRHGGDADCGTLRRAVYDYVDASKSRLAPPERVVANVKGLAAELAPLDDVHQNGGIARTVAQWAIDRYFRS